MILSFFQSMNILGKTQRKVVIVSILLGFLFFGTPERSQAYAGVVDVVVDPANLVQNTTSAIANPVTAVMTTAEKIKEYVLDPAARAIVKTIIQRLTAQTVNWINSGFQGNPAYVTNPDQFFLGVGDTVASQVLSGSALNQLCSPFKTQVRLALVKNYLTDNNNYSCTLTKLKNNYNQFTQDFSQGGWEGWFEVTQNSQNNPYGAYIQAQNQLSIQVGKQINRYQNQLSLGNGFLSFEKCPPGKELDPSLGTGDCSVAKQVVTPGSVIETQLETALGSGVRQLELTRSFDEIVSALVTQLFTRVVGGGSGLYGPTTPLPAAPNPTGGATITPLGRSPFLVQKGGRFADPGVFAYDITDGDVSDKVVSSGSVDVNTDGTYTITYSYVNSKGISATPATLTVEVVDDIPVTTTPEGPQPACTQQGQDEQNFMLPLLNGGSGVQDVIDQTNTKFSLTTGNQAVVGANNTIGLPEFYLAGPTPTRPTSPSTGLPWDVVTRCGGTGTGNTTPGNPAGDGNTWPLAFSGQADAIDLTQATITDAPADVASWPITTGITSVDLSGNVKIDFTKKEGVDRWPDMPFGAGGSLEYTVWLFVKINSQWVGSGFIQMWNGRPDTGDPIINAPTDWYYSTRWAPMTGHQIVPGEQVGLMVTAGNARDQTGVTSVRERSNIVLVAVP